MHVDDTEHKEDRKRNEARREGTRRGRLSGRYAEAGAADVSKKSLNTPKVDIK